MSARKLVVAVVVMGLAGMASALTSADVELAVETALGIGNVSTYLDFTSDSREGLTLTTTAVTNWDYPDTSDGSLWVNGSGLDDKNGKDGVDFEITISGLVPDASYQVFYTVKGTYSATTLYNDFEWGLESDSAPVNYVNGTYLVPDRIVIAAASAGRNVAVPLTTVTANANGVIKMWAGSGNGDLGGSDLYRTQLDGAVLVPVPEPATMVLLGLGSLALLRRKR